MAGLIKYLSGILKATATTLAKDTSCCCGGPCCGFGEGNRPDLKATIISACAAINGYTFTFVSSSATLSDVVWDGVSNKSLDCLGATWQLKCNASPTCDGWTLTVAPGTGCQVLLDSASPKAGCSCDPLDIEFTGVIYDNGPGGTNPCLCCTVGQTVTIKITR